MTDERPLDCRNRLKEEHKPYPRTGCISCARGKLSFTCPHEFKKKVGTIDLTPTWAGILPMLLAAYTDGSDKARAIAREELERMARIADGAVDASRKNP